MIIKNEDIRGYFINKTLVCPEYIEAEELAMITAKDILTDSEMDEEDLYFCDRSGERIEKA